MRKILPSLVALLLIAIPAQSFAAYNDVTLTTSAVIRIGDMDFTVSGSSALIESLTVGTTNFSVIMLTNSTIEVTSANRRIMAASTPEGSLGGVFTCNSTNSVLSHTYTGTGSRTLTVTPEAGSTCTVAGAGLIGGGGGGGGAPSLPAANTNEVKNAITINAGAKETTTRNVTLSLTASNATEMALSNDASFATASFVPYKTSAAWTLTEGNGTKTVYVRFRSSSGSTVDASDTIILTGQPAEQKKTEETKPVVTEKPKTVPPGPSANASPVAQFMFLKNMASGAKGNDVKELQKQLRALKFFSYPTDTGTYGSVTVNAVKAFQKANSLKQTGMVDAATRAKLNGEAPAQEPAKVVPPAPSPAVVPGGFVFKSTLSSGSSGTEVKELQKKLRSLGFFDYPTDTGTYGSATVKAVKAFQKANGISQTGSVGVQTRAALNK